MDTWENGGDETPVDANLRKDSSEEEEEEEEEEGARLDISVYRGSLHSTVSTLRERSGSINCHSGTGRKTLWLVCISLKQ